MLLFYPALLIYYEVELGDRRAKMRTRFVQVQLLGPVNTLEGSIETFLCRVMVILEENLFSQFVIAV